MPSDFPRPYTDELLYSVLARYHIRSGNLSYKCTIEELFGSRTVTAVVDMPCHIDIIHSKMPSGLLYTPQSLIVKRTLYPFYIAFLPECRAYSTMEKMRYNFGGDIHMSTGIMASGINVVNALRFCPECSKEDFTNHGEYYWYAIHQVPGLYFCPIHFRPLLDSKVLINQKNKHAFIAADELVCKITPKAMQFGEKTLEKLYELSLDIKWLFDKYELVRRSNSVESGFQEVYLDILKNKGLAFSNGRVCQHEFISDFRHFYGEDLLRAVNSDVDHNLQDNWLSSIVRKHRKSFHPLRHLLLMKYLSGSIQEFFKDGQGYRPFGEGPWPCMNFTADHYLKYVVKDISITHCVDTKLPVGTFKCDCGFIYSRRGPDRSKDDLKKIGRIKAFGAIWEEKLIQLISSNTYSLREIARKLNVDPNTVKKHATPFGLIVENCTTKNINLNSQDELQSEKQNKNIRGQQINREKWLFLISENHGTTVNNLRKIDGATYTWLYRHDRVWLKNNLPRNECSRGSNGKIDWNTRDQEVLCLIKSEIERIKKSHEKPVRITVGRISKNIGKLALIEKHIDKLPLTREYFKNHVENDTDYAFRKIYWACNELVRQNRELRLWEVLRFAGIRYECWDSYKDITCRIIANQCDDDLYGGKGI